MEGAWYSCKFAKCRSSSKTDWACKQETKDSGRSHKGAYEKSEASEAEIGESLHSRKVGCVLRQSQRYPFLKKCWHPSYSLPYCTAKCYWQKTHWKKVLLSHETEIELFGYTAKVQPCTSYIVLDLTFHSNPPTARPPAAPVPARPINKPLPTLLDISEAPICKHIRIIISNSKSLNIL